MAKTRYPLVKSTEGMKIGMPYLVTKDINAGIKTAFIAKNELVKVIEFHSHRGVRVRSVKTGNTSWVYLDINTNPSSHLKGPALGNNSLVKDLLYGK